MQAQNSFYFKKYFYLLIPITIILLILIKNLDFLKKYFFFINAACILIIFLIFNYNDTPFKINTFNRPPLYPLFMIFGGIYF